MAPEETPGTQNVTPEQPGSSRPAPRGRRGGRGHRGGRRRSPRPPGPRPPTPLAGDAEPIQPGAEPFPAEQVTAPPLPSDLGEAPSAPTREPRETPSSPRREEREMPRQPDRELREPPAPPMREPQPRAPMAVQQAIEEVNHIIETLRATLDDMEAVLETLELAERQKIGDEQEIETLRCGLRQLHRPREGGPQPPRR